jgi:hypothetical protein
MSLCMLSSNSSSVWGSFCRLRPQTWLHRHALEKPTAEINPVSQVTWLNSVNLDAWYDRNLSSFGAKAADDFVMQVSCPKRFCVFYGVCSNFAPMSCSFSLVSTGRFLAKVQKWPNRPDFNVVLGTVFPRNIWKFLLQFLVQPHFTYYNSYRTHCSTVNWTIFMHTITSTQHNARQSHTAC